jgi:thioredoxin reductase (NADPH)
MTNSNPQSSDVVIIGAGPVGLFTVFECGTLGLSVQVVDALDAVGGQCQALYPEKPIFDIPAYPRILAGDLIANLVAQGAPFVPTYHLGQQVVRLERRADGRFDLETSTGTRIDAGAVIIAAGAGAFGPNRPPMENLETYEASRAVQYFVARRADFAGKRLVIAGGGDSAVDWAISLSEVAEKISLVHRRDKFRAAPESLRQLSELAAAGKIEMVTPYQLHGLEGDGKNLSAVVVADLDGHQKSIPADVLLPFFGLAMTLGPIAEWGLNLMHNHIAIDPVTAATSVPGIYAVGDIATYDHKLKLILTGFAEAAGAAHAARAHLNPGKDFGFEYSTSRGVPGEAGSKAA